METLRRKAALAALVVCSAVGAVARAGDPTDDEQYSLELINRMRIEPLRELQRMVNINPPTATGPATWGDPNADAANVRSALDFFKVDADFLWNQWQQLTPAPPLAWNGNLHAAALGHNAKMIEFQLQEHQLPGEPDLGQRLTNAGYNYNVGGENIFAYAEDVEYAHAGFAVDWGLLSGTGVPIPPGIQDPPGHRINIMDPDFREVGISITPELDPPPPALPTPVGPLVITHDFASEPGKSFITGVYYTDGVERDHFYTPGEGRGGDRVTVTALVAGTSSVVKTTNPTASGGYKLDLPAGNYDIAFSGDGGPYAIVYRNVVKGANNVKIDSRTTWITDADASWHDPRNWFAGVPNGRGTIASFYDVATAPRSVSVTTGISVGVMNFENPAGYTITGPGTVGLRDGGSDAAINVIGPGSHEIATSLNTDRDSTLWIDPGASLLLSGALSLNGRGTFREGAGTLTITGPQLHGAGAQFFARGGTTNINSDAGSAAAAPLHLDVINAGTIVNLGSTQHLDQLTIGGARVNLIPGADKVLVVDHAGPQPLVVSGAGQLDLHDNDMIVRSSAPDRQAVLNDVVNLIKSSRSAATRWTGPGITSSNAAANPLTTLAAMLNPGLATFSGEATDENAILIKYTYNGDANLDGRVNADDYFRIDQGFLAQPQNPGYNQGDFNYDGTVNADDYFLIDQAFLGQGAPLEGTLLSAIAVPEPGAALLLLGLGALLLRLRGSPGAQRT